MKTCLIAGASICALLLSQGPSSAQSWQTRSMSLALKGGESVEVTDLYWVINCRSLLTSSPQATILSGPPGVSVVVTEAQVLPRLQQCSKPVKGAKLTLKADAVEDESNTSMTIRVNYATKDGPRENSININLALFPAN